MHGALRKANEMTFYTKIILPILMIAVISPLQFAFAAEIALKGNVEVQQFRDWQLLRQTGTEQCAISISVGLKQSNSGLVILNVLKRENTGGFPAIMTVKVPLGVNLAAGLAYTYPNSVETVGFAWQYCSEATCLASGGISGAELGNLKKESQIFMAFQPLPNSRPLIVPVSLLGFTKAWNTLQKCE